MREPIFDLPHTDGVHVDAPKSIPSTPSSMSADDAAAAFKVADADLIAARERLKLARADEHATRNALARATTAWLAQYRMTPEQNSRQFIASQIEQRAKIASGEIQPAERPRPADSQIDRMNAGGRMRGYGPGYRRGAFSASQYGTRVKLPSEQ